MIRWGVGSDSEPETALGSDSQPGHSPPYQSESRALEGSVFRIYGSQMMFSFVRFQAHRHFLGRETTNVNHRLLEVSTIELLTVAHSAHTSIWPRGANPSLTTSAQEGRALSLVRLGPLSAAPSFVFAPPTRPTKTKARAATGKTTR